MSSIIKNGLTFHGISVESRGVFTNNEYAQLLTYAGQCKDGYACGLGVLTTSGGYKEYAEHGPDGEYDGRRLVRNATGNTNTNSYCRWERGEPKANADVVADGRYTEYVWYDDTCYYNREDCAPNDPRLLALIALVAPVEVRPVAPATHPPSARHSDPKQSSD
jgi:hypothetical protein